MPILGPGGQSHIIKMRAPKPVAPRKPAPSQRRPASLGRTSPSRRRPATPVDTGRLTNPNRLSNPLASHALASHVLVRGTTSSSGSGGGGSSASSDTGAVDTGAPDVSPSTGGGSGSGTGADTSNPTDNGTPELDDQNLVSWLVAWGIIFALLYVFSKTRWGHALIYYGLALALLLLFVINYKTITALLAPASGTLGSDAPSSDTATETAAQAAAVNSGSGLAEVHNGQLTSLRPLRTAAPPVPFSSAG